MQQTGQSARSDDVSPISSIGCSYDTNLNSSVGTLAIYERGVYK